MGFKMPKLKCKPIALRTVYRYMNSLFANGEKKKIKIEKTSDSKYFMEFYQMNNAIVSIGVKSSKNLENNAIILSWCYDTTKNLTIDYVSQLSDKFTYFKFYYPILEDGKVDKTGFIIATEINYLLNTRQALNILEDRLYTYLKDEEFDKVVRYIMG